MEPLVKGKKSPSPYTCWDHLHILHAEIMSNTDFQQKVLPFAEEAY